MVADGGQGEFGDVCGGARGGLASVLVAVAGAGGGDVGRQVEVDGDDGKRGDGGAQGGGGRVAQAVEDEGLTGDPPGVLEDQAGEGIPSAADQFEAESLEALAAGG